MKKSDVYLEPCLTSKIKLFWKNNQRYLTVNDIRLNPFWLSGKY